MDNDSIGYGKFREEVMGSVRDSLPDCSMSIRQVQKNNGIVLDGLEIVGKDEAGTVRPLIYINPYYDEFKEGKKVEEITADIVAAYNEAGLPEEIDVNELMDFDRIKDRIIFRIVNRKMNEERLENMPHIVCMGDLAVIFLVLLAKMENNFAATEVHNKLAKEWEIGTDGLMALAKKNTPRLLHWQLASMREVLAELAGDCLDQGDEFPMYVLTNEAKLHGASCVLYPGVLEAVSERLHGDYFILPSSLHEVIVIPVGGVSSVEELTVMIREVNATQVPDEQVLSDHPYLYTREKGLAAA